MILQLLWGVWYMCLETSVEIRVGEKVCGNACNIV